MSQPLLANRPARSTRFDVACAILAVLAILGVLFLAAAAASNHPAESRLVELKTLQIVEFCGETHDPVSCVAGAMQVLEMVTQELETPG